MSRRSLEDLYFPPRFGCLEKFSVIYQGAVNAMRRLVEVEGVDAAQYAYATATSDPIRKWWAKWKKATLDRGTGHLCMRTILGGTCRRTSCGLTEIVALDHQSLWQRDGKPPLLVCQPYALRLDQMRELVKLANHYDLDVCVTAHSFWNAGDSILIEIERRHSR